MAAPIIISIMLGAFLDTITHKEPLFIIVFSLLGVGGAFRNLFYMAGQAIKTTSQSNQDSEKNNKAVENNKAVKNNKEGKQNE